MLYNKGHILHKVRFLQHKEENDLRKRLKFVKPGFNESFYRTSVTLHYKMEATSTTISSLKTCFTIHRNP